jgi:peptide deformylase
MRTIVQSGNPVLREVAKDVAIEDIKSEKIQKLIRDMKALLAEEEYGVALAAPQVGESLRLFIVGGKALIKKKRSKKKPGGEDELDDAYMASIADDDEVYINPVMTKLSRKKSDKHEGCLSVRGMWGMVLRSEKATIVALDVNGKKIVRGASGFLAHIFQHEMDHLYGVLYTDKAKELFEDRHE